MNPRKVGIAILSLIVICTSVTASPPDLSELAWMSGSWMGSYKGVETEEYWQAPKGASMLGIHRDIAKERTVAFEYFRIEATAEGITFWASPEGRPATPFRLKELKGKHVVFENPEHDFPQRIIYWLGKEGSLHAKIEGTEGGKSSSMEWTWKRSN